MTQRGASARDAGDVAEGLSNGLHGPCAALRLLASLLVNTAPRLEVLRETVKVAKFELPPEALPEPEIAAPEATMKRLKATAPPSPGWERKVVAALWALAAAIVATLWLTRT